MVPSGLSRRLGNACTAPSDWQFSATKVFNRQQKPNCLHLFIASHVGLRLWFRNGQTRNGNLVEKSKTMGGATVPELPHYCADIDELFSLVCLLRLTCIRGGRCFKPTLKIAIKKCAEGPRLMLSQRKAC